MLEALTLQLRARTSLTEEQAAHAVNALLEESVGVELKAEFLSVLAQKGETAAELTGFAIALRSKSIQPPLDAETRAREILDVCGTGGDRLNTFNISTTVALIASAAGVTVAKHGNRAITSQAGSADVLEALGVRIELAPESAATMLRDLQFAFFFAQKYHPTFKNIAAARKLCAEHGQRTIFNFLGPLLNPARPSAQLVGVPRPELCEPMARVLQAIGVRRGMVVSGEVPGDDADSASPRTSQFLDELSTLGSNTIAEFYQERGFHRSVLSIEQFPLQAVKLTDLCGADKHTNAKIIWQLLQGEERGPKRDAVLLNSAAALFVAGKGKTLIDGWELAAEIIDGGKAKDKLEKLIEASAKL